VSSGEEYKLFTNRWISLSDIVYILSRLTSFGFILCSFIIGAAEADDCHAVALACGWCGALAMPLNSLLFFFRARAVFARDRYIVAAFFLLWLATLGCFSIPFSYDTSHIGTTKSCIVSSFELWSTASLIIVGVHDTVVFFAISVSLSMYRLEISWSGRFRAFFTGGGMGSMSKVILTSGQLYYLATVGLNIVAMAVILTPSAPLALRSTLSIPNLALQNSMACRVYRQLKLGLIHEPSNSGPSNPTTVRFAPPIIDRSHNTSGNLSNLSSMYSGPMTMNPPASQQGSSGMIGHQQSSEEEKKAPSGYIGIDMEMQMKIDHP